MIALNTQFILLISGMVGAGKTTVGRKLKEKLSRVAVFDMDDIKWQISDFVRGDGDNAIVRDGVRSLTRNYCKHGISIVLPQTLRPEEPAQFRKIAEEFGYKFLHIELFTDDETAMRRVLARQKSSPNPPSPRSRVERNIAWYHEHRVDDSSVERIDTSNLSIDEVVEMVERRLTEFV
ncbi:AAA family ATPase [Candidatus Uhrbacteria bacterium]|jgi:predicted kinase|nr:AAA family ATPase [Candidatus Uhrbacteria bacterium]